MRQNPYIVSGRDVRYLNAYHIDEYVREMRRRRSDATMHGMTRKRIGEVCAIFAACAAHGQGYVEEWLCDLVQGRDFSYFGWIALKHVARMYLQPQLRISMLSEEENHVD